MSFARPLFGVAFLVFVTLSADLQAQTLSYLDLLARPRSQADQHLAYGSLPDQFGELWLPPSAGLHPVIILIHGGCWEASLPGTVLMDYLAYDLRASGFAVWNIEYRRLTGQNVGYPDTFLDVAKSVDYLRQIAPTYQLDLTHLTIIGHSAGGHLALWAAARKNLSPTSKLFINDPLPIENVITLAGINDLKAYHDYGPTACGGPGIIDQLIDAKRRQDPYTDTSPTSMLPLAVRQIIVSGSLDPIVPQSFGKEYAEKAKKKGDFIKEITFQESGHFELIDPTSQAWTEIKALLQAP